MDSRPMDVHPGDGFALAEDLAFEEQIARGDTEEGPSPRPLGAAFLLGMVAGVTASALLRPSRTHEEPTGSPRRRLLRNPRPPEEPDSLLRAIQDEAAGVARALVRDLGGAASRWLLEAVASRAEESASGSPEEADTGP